jgi:hypothetical protein
MLRLPRTPTLCETCRFWQPDDYPGDSVMGESWMKKHIPQQLLTGAAFIIVLLLADR